ncbi:MAG: dephospho-CoA kinase [Firmicutes bacterium]|nr:dephospho-CoA kinase [Bacillota bacterium]
MEKTKKMLVGITGYSGCGKTTFAEMLMKLIPNSTVISMDKRMREAYAPLKEQIVEIFGKAVFNKGGVLNAMVTDTAGKDKIERFKALKLPLVCDLVKKDIDAAFKSFDVIFLEWIYLPECKLWDKCYKTVFVDSYESVRHDKLIFRAGKDCLTREQAKVIDKNTAPDFRKMKPSFIVFNDFNMSSFNQKAKLVAAELAM